MIAIIIYVKVLGKKQAENHQKWVSCVNCKERRYLRRKKIYRERTKYERRNGKIFRKTNKTLFLLYFDGNYKIIFFDGAR